MEKKLTSAWLSLSNQLHAFVTKKVQNKEIGKDIVHDVFLKAYSSIHTLQDEEKINAWIFQITRNKINDYFRKQKKSRLNTLKEDAITTSFTNDETQELSKCMLPMINLLPEKYREAVILSDIEGLSQKELAEHLQISYSGAKSRVQRGRKKLKEVYLECCVISTDKYGNVMEYHERKCSDNC